MAIPLRAERKTETEAESRISEVEGPKASPSRRRMTVKALAARLDEAVLLGDPARVTARIQEELEVVLGIGRLELDPRFRRPHPDRYARRLLHRSDRLDYTVVVMAWGPGQETPLHDHGGSWCVEGVVEGRIRVTRYELLGRGLRGGDRQLWSFLRCGDLEAGVGEAGALIPPLEHHVLANADPERVAVTLHVYQGEMTRCTTFEPVNRASSVRLREGQEALYRSREQALGYDD